MARLHVRLVLVCLSVTCPSSGRNDSLGVWHCDYAEDIKANDLRHHLLLAISVEWRVICIVPLNRCLSGVWYINGAPPYPPIVTVTNR